MSKGRAVLISILSWALTALAFPPFPLGVGALVFLAPWFYVLNTASKKTALLSTFAGAIIFNLISIYWLSYVGAVAPPALIFTGIGLAACYLSLYTVFAAWVYISLLSRLRSSSLRASPFKFAFCNFSGKLFYLFPLFWASVEVLRSKGDMSFPWLTLGIVFGDNLKLIQGLAVVGIFGYSALIIFSNMMLAQAALKKNWKFALAPIVILAALYVFGAASLAVKEKNDSNFEQEEINVAECSPASPAGGIGGGRHELRCGSAAQQRGYINVAIMQPSIHQTQKWSKQYYDSVMAKTWGLFDKLNPDSIDLILFPETAIPDFINARWREQKFLTDYAEKNNVSIVIGALNRISPPPSSPKKHLFYNSAFLFEKDNSSSEYRKMHLVPFSERLPFDDVIPLLNYVDFGEGDFSSGDSISVWDPGGISPLICYEAIYGGIIRDAKRKGATVIANITNDGWFMRSTAPYQHFNLVRVQAVENGIGIMRAANTGISAFIDADGRVSERTELFEEKFITKKVRLLTRNTIYSQIGDYAEWGLVAFGLILTIGLINPFCRRKNQN